MSDIDQNTSLQNFLNWTDKCAMQLNKLIAALKKIALQDDANVNVDETWLLSRLQYEAQDLYVVSSKQKSAYSHILLSFMRTQRMMKVCRNMEAGTEMY